MAFSQAWLHDPDRIKSELKDVRSLHKILVLGIGYAMGPKKMVKSCYDKGYAITLRDSKIFVANYWSWCPKVKELSDRLQLKFQQQGYLVNDFGYRLIPDKEYKAFNYWIQSSVSGLINILVYKFFSIFSQAKFVTVIHDELIFQVPTELLTQARTAMDQSVTSLNEDLNWSVKVRCGWVEGKNLYEAK